MARTIHGHGKNVLITKEGDGSWKLRNVKTGSAFGVIESDYNLIQWAKLYNCIHGLEHVILDHFSEECVAAAMLVHACG